MTHHKIPTDQKLDAVLKRLLVLTDEVIVLLPVDKYREHKSGDKMIEQYGIVKSHMAHALVEGAKLAEMIKGGDNE